MRIRRAQDSDAVHHLSDAAHPGDAHQQLSHRRILKLHPGYHQHTVARLDLEILADYALLFVDDAQHLVGDPLIRRSRRGIHRRARRASTCEKQQNAEKHHYVLHHGRIMLGTH